METSKPNIFVIQVDQLKPVMPCAYCNGAEFPSSIATFAHYLRALNYLTCLVGQMHFVGADQLHGFEQRLTTDIYPADFNWTELRSGHSNNSITFDAPDQLVDQSLRGEKVCSEWAYDDVPGLRVPGKN